MNCLRQFGHRRYVFEITPGDKFENPTWVFKGVEPIAIKDAAGQFWRIPRRSRTPLNRNFRTNGYLDVESVSTSRRWLSTETKPALKLPWFVGSNYSVENIEFEGNRHARFRATANIIKDGTQSDESLAPFTSAWLDTARQNITSEYWRLGFNDVQIAPSTRRIRNWPGPQSGLQSPKAHLS